MSDDHSISVRVEGSREELRRLAEELERQIHALPSDRVKTEDALHGLYDELGRAIATADESSRNTTQLVVDCSEQTVAERVAAVLDRWGEWTPAVDEEERVTVCHSD